MTSSTKVLVIGAGSSGLAAIKSCKEEGLDVICYEKTKNFGGRWRYSDSFIPCLASATKSTVCVSSKEMGAFSDFPPPKEFPNYLHHTKMLEYLTLYAQNFDLLRYVKYQTEVIKVTARPDYKDNGKWMVTSYNSINRVEATEEFDCVMVCTGRLSHPHIPPVANKENFQGMIIHSQSLRTSTIFENMNVLIVGSGNSAVEAAVEISNLARQVYLSTRNGFWLFPKLGAKGLPFDMSILRRDSSLVKHICKSFASCCLEKFLETKIDHSICKIKPNHRALDKLAPTSDDLPDKILTGRVQIKGEIARFEKNGVMFDSEDFVTELDAVIFATGYSITIPLLEHKLYKNEQNIPNLYKNVFPVNLLHPSLALIGFVDSLGPSIPISESQSRWAVRVFAKKTKLPSISVMQAHIDSNQPRSEKNWVDDYVTYMDELAAEYGAKPNLPAMFFKDFTMFRKCFYGPLLPYQYRLVGPHLSEKARNNILESSLRIMAPFKTKSS